jgi:hypothetical protein
MTETPTDFATLKTQLLVLWEHIAGLPESDHPALSSIHKWSTELKTQIMALPDVPDSFAWLVSGSVVTLLDWTRPLLDILQVMAHLVSEPEIEPLALTSAQKTHLVSAATATRQLDNTIVTLWHQLRSNQAAYEASEAKSVLLHRDLPPLWVVLCYATRFNELVFKPPIFDLPEQSAVAIDLSTLRHILQSVMIILGGRAGQKHHLILSVHCTAQGAALQFTVQGLHMMPERWERLLVLGHFPEHYATLREMGGSIEPLTWDEGQGQGVIVRLPWAR